MILKPHNKILFQGDSITDAGRSRMPVGPNSPDGMGFGYPRLVMDQLLERFPDKYLLFYNRGVSGDRIQDLSMRWQHDTMRLSPDLISILIGVNDTWNYLYLGMGASPEEYQQIYRQLLEETRGQLPTTDLILCEPFVLLAGEVTEEWGDDISQRQATVKELACEFEAKFVPFQAALDKAVSEGIPAGQLLEDGVHPTIRGHRLLAGCWIESVLVD
ncbi:MAG: SGNH/GDSL hydrolase family protein [Anaerolineales bacterium]|jgi:lysophospholipase L1-like esterase